MKRDKLKPTRTISVTVTYIPNDGEQTKNNEIPRIE